jgi:hypothetical protein
MLINSTHFLLILFLIVLVLSCPDVPIPVIPISDTQLGATLGSYPASSQLVEFLVLRIKQENANIKFKCLVIIKVCSVFYASSQVETEDRIILEIG